MPNRRDFLAASATMFAAPLVASGVAEAKDAQKPPAKRGEFERLRDDLFRWTDTCNVYVIKDGDAALLIDLGDGTVLERLAEIGVTRIEWVLFTHHHREQCQGYPELKKWAPKIAVPQAERAFFENPTAFRKIRPANNDSFSVNGASFVRPPIRPIPVDHAFKKMDEFAWRGREFLCIDTPGNSPGGMSYLWRRGERWTAFSGDVMVGDARMHNWFDTEWDYGFAEGLWVLFNSAASLEQYRLEMLLPSHGSAIPEPSATLKTYSEKLQRLLPLYLRGWRIESFGAGKRFGAGADQDPVSRPTAVPHVWQVSPHLYKFKGPNVWVNFTLLLADSGHGLVVDCGLFERDFLEKSLQLIRQKLGLKKIDAVVVTHMHGDHFLDAPYLREKWGAEIWTMDRVVPACQEPNRFDYCAQIPAYGKDFESLSFDRVFKDGATFQWEGFDLTTDWMPGQTEFALCLHGMIDGRRVAFTGDNIFGNPADPTQTGHECIVARNSCMFEEGYLYAAQFLKKLQPDLLIGGHSWVMDKPAGFIDRYLQWALDAREAFRGLSTDEDYRMMFDPYWVRADPYRLTLSKDAAGTAKLHIRNFRSRAQTYRIAVHAPDGLTVQPALLEGAVAAESTIAVPFQVRTQAANRQDVQIVAFDVELDGQRYGEWFDMMVISAKTS